MGTSELMQEVCSRIEVVNNQVDATQAYLVERVREEDWPSVMSAASQLYAMGQELESLSAVKDNLQESYYE